MTFQIVILFALSLAQANNQVGWLHGRVIDKQGAVIPGMRVSAISGTQRFDATSDAEGRYNFQLPVDLYRISATGNNILPYSRALLRVSAAKHQYVMIRPVFRAPSDQEGIKDTDLKYKKISLQDGSEVHIQFEAANTKANQTHFTGKDLMISVNSVTLYGDDLICSNPINLCTLTGTAMAEIENERIEGISITLDFIKRQISVVREPKLLKTF